MPTPNDGGFWNDDNTAAFYVGCWMMTIQQPT
jgi:hypothetical protein